MSEDATDATEVRETEETDDGTTEDPRIAKANREAMTYRRELRQAQAELKKLREANQTETEKALAEAEQRGHATALDKVSVRLAQAELKAAAAGRVDKDTLAGFLEYADLKRFVGKDGEPDTKAIEAAITRLGGAERAPSYDGGARTTAAKPTDMNSLIRQAAGLA